jgi:hypothetical protein
MFLSWKAKNIKNQRKYSHLCENVFKLEGEKNIKNQRTSLHLSAEVKKRENSFTSEGEKHPKSAKIWILEYYS